MAEEEPLDQSETEGSVQEEFDPAEDLGDEGFYEGLDGDAAGEDPAEDVGDLEPGGADDGETGQVDAPQDLPELPPGFTDWRQVAEALKAQQQRQVEPPPVQAQPPQQQQPDFFQWQPPHEWSGDLEIALRAGQNEEWRAKNPHEWQRAQEYSQYVDGHWGRWTRNPNDFVRDVVFPQLAPIVHQLDSKISELRQAESGRTVDAYYREHGLAEDAEARAEFEQLVLANVPHEAARELVQLRKAERRRAARQGEQQGKRRDQEARKRAARGKGPKSRSPRNRSGSTALDLAKKDRANPHKIADEVLGKAKRGEL